ncbi:acyltransferase (plasmid) [Leisingera sp. M527]|uniref:acyltransferase family protein n=1 Tax=Leisingera sp. M527 TaxID=2867014 RepID=UPI0021A70AD7|nr:acyltransferase family protein [Leisingera sp. M527]UWQ35136.1 acyltransferase [Leisingera sp. M527]
MKYRSEIDGLRTLAVVPVILFHAGIAPFGGGYIGVDVFFVISGYLISSIIFNELERGEFSVLRFYQRRARRILPALFFVVLASLPFAWSWLMPRDLKDFLESLIGVLFFLSNFHFWSEAGYFDTAAELKPLLHTWSLAVEEQYYVIYPLLLMLLMPLGGRAVTGALALLFAISLALSHWGLSHHPSATFFLLPPRGWELLAGVFAAMLLRRDGAVPGASHAGMLAAMGLLMILAPVFIYTETTRFPGAYALPPVLGTVLIILFAAPGSLVHRLLSAKPMISVGLISYSAYLWHQPIFAFFKHRFGSASFDQHVFELITLTFLLAVFSYWVVEKPFRRTASLKQFTACMSACFVLTAGATAALMVTVRHNHLAIPSYKWALDHAPADLVEYSGQSGHWQDCADSVENVGLKYCRFGAADQPVTLVLWGDSLAGALLHGMDLIADENGIAGMAFVSDACPPVLGLRNTSVSTCSAKTHEEAMKRIMNLPDAKTVLITGNLSVASSAGNVLIDGQGVSPGAVRQKIRLALETFKEAGLQTVLIQEGPIFDEPVAAYELQRLRSNLTEPQSIPRTVQEARTTPTHRLANEFDSFVGTVDFFCGPENCPSVDGEGKLVIFDQNHITKTYSTKLAKLILSTAGSAPGLQ